MTTRREEIEPSAGDGPLVSVLMPSYNHEAFVAAAVESVWRQTHRPLELIAVDDGSSDATAERLDELMARSPIPMTVHRQENRGIAGALNSARAAARGSWLSVLASDDAYHPEKIERQLAAAAKRPGCLAVHSDYVCIGPDGEPSSVYQGSRLPPAEGDSGQELRHGRRTVHSVTLMVRAAALDEAGGWDESYPQEDWPLILRLGHRGEIAFCPDAMVCRRVHPANVSSRMSRLRVFDPRDAAVDLLAELCDSPRELEECLAVHIGVVLRNSIAAHGWRRARGALAWAWRAAPSRRLFLLGQVARGLTSLLWLDLARPLLPRGWAERLSAARSRRRAARANRGRRGRRGRRGNGGRAESEVAE